MRTMYEHLQAHIAKHAYKRGKNKGDAPLDAWRRSRSHERVSPRTGCMAVHFHNTDVILAYPDGRIVLDCDGWGSAPTTRTCVNDALRRFGGNNAWLYSDRLYGKTQLVLKTARGQHAYYDGITIDADGTLLSEPKPFEGKRIDKAASKELYADMQECGFKDVFKLLHAVAEKLPYNNDDPLYDAVRFARPAELRDFITMELHANKWPYVVDRVSFHSVFNWRLGQQVHTKRDHKEAWARLMEIAKRDLYNTVAIEEDTTASTV